MPIPKLDTPGRRILALSLAVNLALFAVIAGHALWHHGPPPNPAQVLADLADRLPEVDGRILRLALKVEETGLQSRDFDPRTVLQRMQAVLVADPFDPAALTAVAKQAQGDRAAFEQALLRAVIAAATAMSPEGRHRLAELPCLPPPPKS